MTGASLQPYGCLRSPHPSDPTSGLRGASVFNQDRVITCAQPFFIAPFLDSPAPAFYTHMSLFSKDEPTLLKKVLVRKLQPSLLCFLLPKLQCPTIFDTLHSPTRHPRTLKILSERSPLSPLTTHLFPLLCISFLSLCMM